MFLCFWEVSGDADAKDGKSSGHLNGLQVCEGMRRPELFF